MGKMKYSLLLVTLATFTHAHSIRAAFVNRPDAPLQITAMVNGMQDFASEIDFQNTSNQAISSFQVGWVTAVPASCVSNATAIPPIVRFAPVQEATIAAGGTFSGLSYKIGTNGLLAQAKQLGGHHMELDFGVVSVHFADGTSWSFDLASAKSFDEGVAMSEFGCDAAFDARRANATLCADPGATPLPAPAPLSSIRPKLPKAVKAMFDIPQQFWVCLDTSMFVRCSRYNGANGTCNKDYNNQCCVTTSQSFPFLYPQKICYLESIC